MTARINGPQAVALGKEIREERLRRDLVLLEVAAKLGIDHSQLSRIERGQFRRLSSNVQKLCKFLKLGANRPHSEQPASLEQRLKKLVTASPKNARLVANFFDALEADDS